MKKLEIEKIKKAQTKIIGKQIEYFKEINSTNIYAEKIADRPEENGKVIIAEIQTNGIGTKGRSWYTGVGNNIAMTIILKPKCNLEKLEGITVKIAECIKEAIFKLYNIQLEIKKPNDLILNNKKICGILTKTNTIGEKINYLIIGIGLNVNEEHFDKETINIATSLKKEFKKEFSREDIIIKIIEILEKELEI